MGHTVVRHRAAVHRASAVAGIAVDTVAVHRAMAAGHNLVAGWSVAHWRLPAQIA